MRRILVLLIMVLIISVPLFSESNVSRPEPVYKRIGFYPLDGENTLLSETEYHGYMQADFESVVGVLKVLDGSDELFPHVKECEISLTDDGEVVRRIKTSYKVLGFGRTYRHIEVVHVLEDSPDLFWQTSRMTKSLDGRLKIFDGHWKVSRCKDDPDKVYVELYSYLAYDKPFFLQETILETFTDGEMRDMFARVEAEAQKIAAESN